MSVKWATGCVLVCRIHPNTPNVQNKLRDYFENTKISKGGPICKGGICITDSEREAVVEFKSDRDAENIIRKKSHRLDGEELEVLKCPISVYNKYMIRNTQDSSITEHSSTNAEYEDVDKFRDTNANQLNRDDSPPRRTKETRQQSYLSVKPNVEDVNKQEEETKTVIVEGLTPDLSIDFVELYFENAKKSGGGPIQSIDHEENSSRATLVFEQKEAAKNVLAKRSHTISGTEVIVLAPKKREEVSLEEIAESDEPITLKITGIDPNVSEEMLGLFLEHKRKSGGGDIDTIEFDKDKRSATVIYTRNDDAERVLSRKTLTFDGNEMQVQQIKKPKWDGRSVYVTGITNMSREVLELLYENKKKSGGGPIETIVMQQNGTEAIITFENEKDAAHVLYQEIVETKQGTVLKASKPLADDETDGLADEEEEQIALSRSIMVLGLDETVTEEILEMLFENESKTGGGEVESVKLDTDFGMAVITFLEYDVAERVLARENLAFQNCNLILQPHKDTITESQPQGAVAEIPVKQKTSHQVKDPKFNCIEVTGLRPDIPRDFVYLFFESKKSGGGEIEEMSFDEETGAAIITFKDEETTKSVLQKHSSSPLSISGAQLQICLLDTSLYGGSLPGLSSCAIEVTGLPVNATVDVITMFFENRRMSGGSTVEEVSLTAVDGKAIITFETSDVAQRVLDKHKAKPLKYEENQLQIRLLSSKSRPPQVPGPKEANTLFLKNLPEDADTEDIRCYLERVGICKFQECIFGITAGTALVRFVFMPGYDKFYELSYQKPLKGCMVDIQSVPISRTIEVFGAGNASEQMLMMYFEHPKSKGGEVEVVNIVPEHGCAIITFKTHGVAEQVLSHLSHKLEGKQLKLNLHHECLGVIPPDHDYTNPTAGIPSHVTITQFDKDIVAFILNTQSNWTYIEDEMGKIYGEVNWPSKSSSTQDITIKCTLQRSTADIQRKVLAWAEDVKASFDGLLSQYAIEYVDTLKDAWDDLYNYCKDIKPKDPANAFVTIDKTNCSVTIIGRRKVVDQLMESLTKAKHDIEGRLSRQAQVTTEPVTNLKSHQVYFLVAHKFPQHMKEVFADMKVETDIKNANVSFIGVPSDIMTAKLQMYELVNQMVSERTVICKPIGILLRQKIIRDYLLPKYREANVVIVYDAIDTELTVYAKSKEDLETGMAIIKRTVIERSITVQEDSRVPLRSQHWTSLKEDMLKDYDGELIISVLEDFSNIQVVASERVMDGVLETIANYLKDNTILKKIINMESGTFKLMSKCLKTDLDTIEKEFSHSSVKILPSRNSSKPGFHVEGTQYGLPQAVVKVKDLAKNIEYKAHEIDKHGMPKCFHEERGRSYLHSLESRYKVAIELEKDKMHENDGDSRSDKSRGTMVKGKVILSGGQVLCVAEGDLTTYQVDAIVNAANAELKHYGGLAGAILAKGGNIIQDECTRFVQQNSSLLNSEVFVSNSGRLPCQKIIHAVGPKWQGGHRNEENELYEAVCNSLEAATKHSLKSIAIPAISSGIFGFPLAKSCHTVVTAVKEYFEKENSTLQEIHLVDNTIQTVNTFYESLLKEFGRNKVQNMDGRSHQPGNAAKTRFRRTMPQPQFTTQQPSFSSYWKSSSSSCLQTKEGISVSLVKGGIHTQQVDVIVNSTRTDLQLGSGGVSATILAAAGITIQQQCQQQAPGGINPGEIIATDGGNLRCQAIYHGACPHYQDASVVKILENFVRNCLIQAHASNMSSIAFPAIGTGNLGFPRNIVAKHMFEEVKKFSENYKGTSLVDIRFIVFDQDIPTVQTFHAEMDRLKSGGSSQKTTTHRVLMKTTSDYGSDTDDEPWEVIQSTQPSWNRGPSLGQRDISQLHMTNCLVTIVQGDITCERTDAIVNSTNKSLNFGSQVSRAILAKGGADIAIECASIGQVDAKNLAITGAGDLPCRKVIHVAAPNDPDAFRYTSKWKSRVKNILEEADKMGCSKISFPALGTGILHTDASKMAATMFDAFYDFQENQPKNLNEIRVVVFDDKMVDTFVDLLKRMDEKKKGFLQVVTDTIQAVGQYFSSGKTSDNGGRNKYAGSTRNTRQAHTSTAYGDVHPSQMVFHIYGLSQADIDQVAKTIDSYCDDESNDRVLDSRKDQETISKLSEKQVSFIEGLEKKHHVKITINRGARVNRIRIQGQNRSTNAVVEEIWKIFRDVDSEERDKCVADLISKQVQWQFENHGVFEPYPPEINLIIEQAFQNKDLYVDWNEKNGKGSGHKKLRLNFSQKTEEEVGTQGFNVRVRRHLHTKESDALPAHWTSMKPGVAYIMVDVTPGSNEHNTVLQKFTQDLQQKSYHNIIKIQRLQNPSMYKKYMVQKAHMDAANPPNIVNEKQLWHGTSSDTLDEIHTSGFNRSFCGKNGTAHGKGVYFATYASLSAGYATPDISGCHYMYLCKVLTGEYCKSHPTYLVPPPKNAAQPSIKYDSVVDNTTTPKILVIFTDTQSYPEYLITYK